MTQELKRATVDGRKAGSRETSLEFTCHRVPGTAVDAWLLARAPEKRVGLERALIPNGGRG